MKVAVAVENGSVAQHFGKCQEYAVFDFIDGRSENLSYVPNPGHQPGFLPRFLKGLDVDCIIAGGMGQKALVLFAENNIKPIVGVSGQVSQVIKDFVNGKLVSGSSLCTHPDGEHDSCGGHC
ncbi:MAG TPA: dinitrogenase iron-molybdenum cofactor [Desulfotomaculum sp.]|nr:MAG: dinitrogenase iron-molybdenum cofactor [Peptococcaceae bacterium BRH_c8a]KJS76034.1 MAG: dinitrogenase iron-molybdenum cofactor [Desulfotomaculum sp. BICA1-6]HBX24613.1 dinitrogenase iron-molybdenum cofactor [Desulfotomaculum sp.]